MQKEGSYTKNNQKLAKKMSVTITKEEKQGEARRLHV
jgi:hypothetical protein